MRFHPGTYTPQDFTAHVLALRSDSDPKFGISSQFEAEVVLGQSSFAVFRWPENQSDVPGWCVFVRFDGTDMEPRGQVPEILTSESLERTVPPLASVLSQRREPGGVSPGSEIRVALSPFLIGRSADTDSEASPLDGSMLLQCFKEQFAVLLAPDFAGVAARLLARSISQGPKWSKRDQTRTWLPLTQPFLRR